MKFLNVIFFVFFYFNCLNIIAQTDEDKLPFMELNGYLKEVQTTCFRQKIDSIVSANLIHNRLNFKINFIKKITSRVEIRNRIFYGEQIKRTPNFGNIINQYNGLVNLSHLWINKKNFVVHSVIDRALIEYSNEYWNIKLGRQRINWGINTIWNPNDIFNAYNFLDFDYEERPGNDAIRIQHNLSINKSLELTYKPGKNKNESIVAVLYKINKWKYDFQFLSGIYQSDFVIGGGWAGNIKEAGFKGELSCFLPKINSIDASTSFSISLMADQTFKNNWYVSISGLFNSNPSNLWNENESIYSSNLSAKLLFPFQYNFHFNITKTISPITLFTFASIYSPEKNTVIILPSFSWNIATNFDLDLISQSFFSKEFNSFYTVENNFYLRSRLSF